MLLSNVCPETLIMWQARKISLIQYRHGRCPKAKFRRRTSHEPNRMQMRKILCSPSLAFDSAHVKYGV